jgi:amino acid adenylation domain-containing protein
MQNEKVTGLSRTGPNQPFGDEIHPIEESAGIDQFQAGRPFVPEMVSAQAEATPRALALTSGGEILTYEQLESRSNQIASLLTSFGVGPEVLVAVCLERSLSWVVAELGVLKSGGAYVPLDPAYPAERLHFMLNDAQTPVLITEEGVAERLPAGKWRVLYVGRDEMRGIPRESKVAPASPRADRLAYVIYTSGSTGQPKGAEITHGNLLNLVVWHQAAFGVTPADRASQHASPAFDAAVWELWPYLGAGASVHLCDEGIRKDPQALRDWLVTQRITVSFMPTGLAEQLMALDWPQETALRFLLTGADALHRFPPSALPFAVVNNYGPTECTVVATSGIVRPSDLPDALPPIGRPIANCQAYILDESMESVVDGQVGELCIGGAGVGRGYLNRPDLTAEKFIPNPFVAEPGDRIYRTGDLARYLPDGQIAFLGRLDDQIKIRGYRIEPNEIVTMLTRHPSVQAGTVVAQEDPSGDKRLVAYIVPSAGANLTSDSLREHLQAFLPAYAIPALFVSVERLPLTPNGKIDREALPAPDDSNILRDLSTPEATTELEGRVTPILAQLLGIQTVGVHDNFFLLGGDSLLGTRVIARVRETFGVNLPLRTIFEAPTAAELASEIERSLRAKIEAMSEEEANQALEVLMTPPAGQSQ